MPAYILKRLAALIPLLLLVSVVVFLLLRVAQGDPAMAYLRLSRIPPTGEALAAVRRMLELDLPLWEQYVRWLARALAGDFGTSYVTGRPVLGEVLHYLPATLHLAGAALLLTMAVSVPLGVGAALHRDRPLDNAARALSFTGVSLPNFWLGFLLVWLFAVKLGWLPALGRGGPEHLVLPAVTLSLMSMGINTRLIRTSLLENMHARHIMYARARGLSERGVVWRHMFKNSLIPVLTSLGMHVGELLGGAVIVETVFAWPGVGRYAVSAVYNRDYPILQCFMLLMTAIFVLCNLAVDILYAWADPRIRLGGERA